MKHTGIFSYVGSQSSHQIEGKKLHSETFSFHFRSAVYYQIMSDRSSQVDKSLFKLLFCIVHSWIASFWCSQHEWSTRSMGIGGYYSSNERKNVCFHSAEWIPKTFSFVESTFDSQLGFISLQSYMFPSISKLKLIPES